MLLVLDEPDETGDEGDAGGLDAVLGVDVLAPVSVPDLVSDLPADSAGLASDLPSALVVPLASFASLEPLPSPELPPRKSVTYQPEPLS